MNGTQASAKSVAESTAAADPNPPAGARESAAAARSAGAGKSAGTGEPAGAAQSTGTVERPGTAKAVGRTGRKQAAADAGYEGFTEEELGAMKERAKELKAAARRGPRAKADTEGEVLAKIAEMPEADRALAERVHALVKANAPDLTPKLWYGMPAYARDGKVVCFFQSAGKFSSRYATLGFSDRARLDEGTMWPTYFALAPGLSDADEARIAGLIAQAVA